MKKILKLVFLFTFILCFSLKSFAAGTLGITSVVYDNSNSFLSINSSDNQEFSFDENPKLHIIEDENKAYFDITSAILKCPKQSLVINNSDIKEIIVSQFTTGPDVVRVVFSYNENFKPKNIRLKKINNTLILSFKNPVMTNYYFQKIYTENTPSEVFETTELSNKIVGMQNIMGQINSAFNSSQNDDDINFIVTNKNLLLKSAFYINNVDLKNSVPVITGIGSVTLSKPIYLSNPNRVAFDIKNAIVNPSLRNKDYPFGSGANFKIGQFDKNTARVVITSSNPEKFVPVIYSDTQKIAFIDLGNNKVSYTQKTDLTAVKYEKQDVHNHCAKFVFDKPLILGLERTGRNLNVYLLNVDTYYESSITSELRNTPFETTVITGLKSGGFKLSIPADSADLVDVFLGSDGKTLRISERVSKQKNDTKIELQTPEIVIPVVPEKIKGKRYVVIDAGHGGSDCGATRDNIFEKDITLKVALKVEKLLQKKGYVVTMTRTTDQTLSLQERVDISEAIAPDIFVSIHVNSSNSDSPNGLETHYYKDNSLKLAKCIHAAMLNNISAHNRGLFKSKFYVINHTTAPAILVEMGFISNAAERSQLVSESRQNATAKAIVDGIEEYFK